MLIAINTLLAVGFRAIDWRAHVGGLVAGAIAGWLAEGVGLGSESTRRFAGAFGLVALALLGVAVVAWRVSTFPHIPGAWPVSF
jgi:hypothetical protein